MTTILSVIGLAVAIIYSFALIFLLTAFRKLNAISSPQPQSAPLKAAVVIAVRNEEKNVQALLESLRLQNSEIPFEIILADDESTDNTIAVAKDFKNMTSLNLRVISAQGQGKKRALESAIAATDAEIIIVTDGDCIVRKSWVQSHLSCYCEERTQFVAGVVTYKKKQSILRNILETELIFLQVASAGLFAIGNPVMCNGANMSFRRKLFDSTGGFRNDSHVSGDDLSLLYRANQLGERAVVWNLEKDGIVETESVSSISAAISQRKRWLSKMSSYATGSSVVVAVLFLAAQLILPLTVVSLLAGLSFSPWLLLAFGIKTLVELLFLSLAVPFFGEERIIRIFPAAVVLYNYISISSVVGLLKRNVVWKGRTWKMGRIQ